ncbi:hypothetical protein ACFQ60_28270 [Streptomyces zhihengii]
MPGETGELLTLVSPAADAHAAGLLLSPAAALTTTELRHALDADGWPRCDEHFVADHCLRIVLLHQLYHREPDHASWVRGHQRLATHYAGASPASPHQYHHELSIGLIRNAVAHLHGSLYLMNTAVWLDNLLHIASAPVFAGIDERRRLAFTGGHHEPERRVARLLNAAWLAQDRLELPEARLEAAARGALYAMRDDVADGSVLTDAAEQWAESIRSGRPCGSAPAHGGDGRTGERVMNNLTKILIGAAAAVVLLLGIVYVPDVLDPDRTCSAGVERPEDSEECIGVSATGYDFGVTEIREVARAIGAENEEAAKSGDLMVSVAVMMPFSSTAPEQLTKMRHELQGVPPAAARQPGRGPAAADPGPARQHR